jgi:hypothetical protein
MIQVFLLGLPRALRRRIESALEGRGVVPSSVIADIDSRGGRLQLMPKPHLAVNELRGYCEAVEGGYQNAEIYVLPYAPVPDDVRGELEALRDMGAEIIEFEMECDGWPYLHLPRPRIDEAFLNKVFDLLILEIVGADEGVEENKSRLTPSQYILQAAQNCPYLVIVDDAIDLCDQTANHRHPFILAAIDAFVVLIERFGEVGVLRQFFQERGLHHAQTGGIGVELDIKQDGVRIRRETHHTHLKSGDGTTVHGAVRIYYQCLLREGIYRVFILYVGPHPNTDFSRTIELGS